MNKVIVNKEKCISCGACVGLVEEVFEFGEDDLAQVKENVDFENMDKNLEEEVKDAIEGCPTDAIEELETNVKDNI
ncbi:MAG: ferredoxin [Bacilli bacterium]|nr:ferredoxin [Bacilli bacterium]MCI9434643.1 ferredoxin [Bacilli bacterium]